MMMILFACKEFSNNSRHQLLPVLDAGASLIIGDSAIEIQEVDSAGTRTQSPSLSNNAQQQEQSSVILGSTQETPSTSLNSQGSSSGISLPAQNDQSERQMAAPIQMPGPLKPIMNDGDDKNGKDDVTDGDKNSRGSHDYDINEPGIQT